MQTNYWVNNCYKKINLFSIFEPAQKKEGSRLVTRDIEDYIFKLDRAKEIAI